KPLPERLEAPLVAQGADRGEERHRPEIRATPGIADAMEPARVPHPGLRSERLQVERRVVQRRLRLGGGGREDLEAAVEKESADPVGAHPPADLVGGLEQEAPEARRGESPGAGETSESRPDDDDVGVALGAGHQAPPSRPRARGRAGPSRTTPAARRRSATTAAQRAAPGVSPCRHKVVATTPTGAPSCATTRWSRASARAWVAASSGSA